MLKRQTAKQIDRQTDRKEEENEKKTKNRKADVNAKNRRRKVVSAIALCTVFCVRTKYAHFTFCNKHFDVLIIMPYRP